MVGGPSGNWIDPFPRVLRMLASRPFVSQDMRFFLSELKQQDLSVLRDLIESKQVMPVIDRRYRMQDIGAAIAYLESGRARGKVVITAE